MISSRAFLYPIFLLLFPAPSLSQATVDAGPYKCPLEAITVTGGSDGEISAQYQIPLNGRACNQALKLRGDRQRLNLWRECNAAKEENELSFRQIPGCKSFGSD